MWFEIYGSDNEKYPIGTFKTDVSKWKEKNDCYMGGRTEVKVGYLKYLYALKSDIFERQKQCEVY